jgi:hypothetical protein
MLPRSPRSGRLLTGALLLGAVGAALAPAGPDALVPLKVLAASAADTVCMGVVIDYGKPSSPPTTAVPPPTSTQRIDVPSGSTDLDALNKANDPFAQNGSGLVCAINGYPADYLQNCQGSEKGQYFFWAYWQGNPAPTPDAPNGTWTYAGEGPASHSVVAGATYVEGWSFQNPGPASPGAAKPSVSPATAFASACPGIAPVGTTKTTTPTTTTTADTSTSPTTSISGSTSSGGGKSTPATSTGHGTTSTSPGQIGGPTTVPASGVTPTTAPGEGKGTRSSQSSPHKIALTSTAARHGSGGSAGGIVTIVLVLAFLALLGSITWMRWRRRPAEE